MDQIRRSKTSSVFDGVKGNALSSDIVKIINSYVVAENHYNSAIREITWIP